MFPLFYSLLIAYSNPGNALNSRTYARYSQPLRQICPQKPGAGGESHRAVGKFILNQLIYIVLVVKPAAEWCHGQPKQHWNKQ
jgi:hypothetical protein